MIVNWSLFTSCLSLGLASGFIYTDATSNRDKCVMMLTQTASCLALSVVLSDFSPLLGFVAFSCGSIPHTIYRAYMKREVQKVMDGRKEEALRRLHA